MKRSARPARIGACVSGHGFGHATRTIAVLQALGQRMNVELTVVTTTPVSLYKESLAMPCRFHACPVDVGLVQQSGLLVDIPATLKMLRVFYQQAEQQVAHVAALLADCDLVLCDIAPLGLAAAKRAGVPAVLMENFTWDWIYAAYAEHWPQLREHIAHFTSFFELADYRVQAVPICRMVPCDLQVEPIARPLRNPERLRKRLFLKPDQRLVLLTMGGMGLDQVPVTQLLEQEDTVFVLPGWSRENEFTANLRFLGSDSSWYHPDLMAAADLVVGKLGYSTVAEAYQSGTPYAYVPRKDFAESAVLASFVSEHLPSRQIEPELWVSGAWVSILPPLPIRQEPLTSGRATGADQVAEWLVGLLDGDV
ncbi:MAG: hypothetical protein GXY53_01430 [Desulfobulbus sp.]|nr:hypothetical protein [Desulfobulbus sp.]